jgi:signal transduction histidine kinase
MSRMIDDLLTLARLENISDSSFTAVDLNHIIREICAMRQPMIEEKQLNLTLDLAGTDPVIQADEADLGRAIANLLDNALRYTPQGGRIVIQTEAGDEEVKVRVTDSGVGIDDDDLPHIFDRFFRAGRTASIDGTGLGLAITRKIIERHQGKIEVNSVVGKGTDFILSLPC